MSPANFAAPSDAAGRRSVPAVSRRTLLLEFAALYGASPLIILALPFRLNPLPLLWLATVYCLIVLRKDPGFEERLLWNAAPLRHALPAILGLFFIAALTGVGLVYLWARPALFEFIRAYPVLWAAVMVFYPVMSVYPQGVVYRAFLLRRYPALFANQRVRWLVSAAAFSFGHIIFRNPLAVDLTFAGGLLFAYRYAKTGSLLTSCVEHALYGCFLFTVGLGRFFYHAA